MYSGRWGIAHGLDFGTLSTWIIDVCKLAHLTLDGSGGAPSSASLFSCTEPRPLYKFRAYPLGGSGYLGSN